ncbi:MAG: Coenzyme F420 hydrogenase/dehydrogenase, beta subunit C-terminal domain [Candidatus Omnitrophota bacterium]|jgi:coenzyme F420-reducing hydrogenase beta subunit
MVKLAEKEKCTGCSSCYNICPVNAITMVEDEEGFLRPQINKDCTNCGLCSNVCPEISGFKPERSKNPIVYAAWSLDKSVRMKSSSGGIFSILAEYALERGGVVFGAVFDENLKVKHAPALKVDDLSRFRGSKYVQSEINDSFRQIKKHLDGNKKVLFSGTPCQAAGLLSFLGKDYDNLIVCDVICHGVASPKVFEGYLKYLHSTIGAKVTAISFREKCFGWNNPSVKLIFENNRERVTPHNKDEFFMGFLNNMYLRPSCGICRYATIPRIGDVTIGDFWRIGEDRKFEYDTFNGVSAVLINSEKGSNVFNSCRDKYFRIERELDEAVKYNMLTGFPSKPSKHRAGFFLIFNKKGFGKAANKYLGRISLAKIIAKIIGPKGANFIKLHAAAFISLIEGKRNR